MLPEIANLKFSCKFISGVFTYFWQKTFYIPSCWIILELHVKWNRCNFLKFLCFLIYIFPIVPIQGHCQQNLTTIDTTVNVSYICTRWQNKPHYFYNLIAILYIYMSSFQKSWPYWTKVKVKVIWYMKQVPSITRVLVYYLCLQNIMW